MVMVPRGGVYLHRYKPLNSNILREGHSLPLIDETLVQLAGTAVFSKLVWFLANPFGNYIKAHDNRCYTFMF